jgi:cation diffusion facilitator family transporter
MTDVWTTGGVLVGIALVWLTGWLRLDAIVALLVAANIIFTGYKLLVRSGRGLLDVALPQQEMDSVKAILDSYESQGVRYHALRSRQAAARRFLAVHLLVPGSWTISRGHRVADEVEMRLHEVLPVATVLTHIEPMEDPLSFQDTSLDRSQT